MADKDKPSVPLEELKAHRTRKRDELREAGVHPYSNTFRPEHHSRDVRRLCADAEPSGWPGA
jgi:hypothetical protein